MCDHAVPLYVRRGFLNEKTDVYSCEVVLLEAVTGRDTLDYSRSIYDVLTMLTLKPTFCLNQL